MTSWTRLECERGPIRPPSESRSLLLRIIKNCPWNRCTFCPVYKNTRFSSRSPGDVLEEIERIGRIRDGIEALACSRGYFGDPPPGFIRELFHREDLSDTCRFVAAWLASPGRNIFLQDADPLVMKSTDLAVILESVREILGSVGRITAYSRASTTHRLGTGRLTALREAGLSRVHTGLESGSDAVLALHRKGVTAEMQISGGLAVREAGLELSLYIMPGLGGREHSRAHARETAAVISAVEPDFIRLRTLAVIPGTPLFQQWRTGAFTPLTEWEILQEIRMFLEHLEVSRGRLVSDHILNLLGDLEGDLPGDIPALIRKIDTVLQLSEPQRLLFQTGKRLGVFQTLDDLEDPVRRIRVERFLNHLEEEGIPPEEAIREIMTRFV